MPIDSDADLAPPIHAPRRHAHRRRLWVGLALIATAGLGVFVYRQFFAEAAATFTTEAVVIGDVETTVAALGSLQPKDYVDVGAQVSGQLETVHVEIGDRVEKDDLLAEIDPTVLETRTRTNRANLANLRAQRAQQEAELGLARQQLKRNRNLFNSKIVSQDTLQTSEMQVRVAEAKMAGLEAQIEAAQAILDGDIANLGYTKIYAPMTGTVVSQSAVEGQTLNASQTAPTIVRIADLDTMTVRAQVAEADVVKLATGMPAYFTTLGLPERRWQATVRQILPTPETINDVVLYNVLIDVDNADRVLMANMTAQVFVLLGEAKGVPVIPVAALSLAPTGAAGEYRVRVLTKDGPVDRTVRIGLASRTSAQVLSGLEVGEQVIVDTPSGVAGALPPARGTSRIPGMGFRL